MTNNEIVKVADDVRAFVNERIHRIISIPDLNLTDDEKVFWIQRFNLAGRSVLTFAADCSSVKILEKDEARDLYTRLNNAAMRAKRKVTGSAL